MPNEVRENTTINKSWSVVHPLARKILPQRLKDTLGL